MNETVIFCANCQAEVSHQLFKSSYSGEIIATCTECGRQLKFPGEMSQKQFDELLAAHKEANEGQQVVAPGGVGPADVVVPAGPQPAPEPEAQEVQSPQPEPEVPEPHNVQPLGSPEQAAMAATEGDGPRAQENLTPAEREAWEQMNKPSPEAAPVELKDDGDVPERQ